MISIMVVNIMVTIMVVINIMVTIIVVINIMVTIMVVINIMVTIIVVINIMVTIMVVINIMAIRVLVTLITQVENACHWWMPASDTWELGPKMSRRRYQVFRYQGHGTWISRLRTLAIFPCQYQGI